MPQTQREPIDVVIIGAGISGIAQAVRLQEALGARVHFKVFERSTQVGGVWEHSRWPGVAVDVPIHLYSLYSHLNPSFTTKWAGGDEVLRYWRQIIIQQRLEDHFVFETEFVSSRWIETTQKHVVTLRDLPTQETFEVTTDVVISATGALNKPVIPRVPGIESFDGIQFHSSRWRADVDLKHKRVAVVGNGSSGIQATANIVGLEGIEVTNFIRSPGYFRPKENFAYSWWQRFVFKWVPFALRLYRAKIFIDFDRTTLTRGTGAVSTKLRNEATDAIVRYMKRELPQKYWSDLIPTYPMGCKRVAADAGWLRSFRRANVELVSSPIVRVTERGLVTADGVEHEFDVIAWATGFEVSDTGVGLNHGVFGAGGKELSETYRENGGAFAYLGVAVPGVPNFFAPLAANAAAMSWGFSLGNNTEVIARLIKGMYDQRLSSIVVKDSVMESYNADVQRRVKRTAWSLPTCGASWYKSKEGKVVVAAPWSATETWVKTRKIKWEDWTCSRLVSPSGIVEVVEVASPRTWSPIELLRDFVANRLAHWLEGLMTRDPFTGEEEDTMTGSLDENVASRVAVV
ncbi:hypothetical protein JCM11491_007009 [Sporobolomyces phaffii]